MGGKWNNNYIKQGMVLTISLCIVVVFALFVDRLGIILGAIGRVLSALTPVVIGCIIAFLLNPIMVFFQNLFKKLLGRYIIKKNEQRVNKISKGLSVTVSILLFISCIAALLWVLIPELAESIEKLYMEFPGYIRNAQEWAEETLKSNPEFENMFSNYISKVQDVVMDFFNTTVMPNMDTIIAKISSGVLVGLRFLLNFLIGIIVAVYVLIEKEELGAQAKKIVYAIFSKKKGNRILDAAEYANSVFSGFISGTIIASILVGVVCAIFCTLVDMPYAILISVFVGVTNVIPFFGPFIGAIPSALLVLVEDPMMCLVFCIFILVWQQIDGNIITPLILGDATGLSSLWVLVAILIGGNLFGFAGMLLGVPVFACIYTLLTILLRDRLKKKGMSNKTEKFLHLRRFDEETGEPIYGEKPKRMSAKKRKKHMKMLENQRFHLGDIHLSDLHIGRHKDEDENENENDTDTDTDDEAEEKEE